MALVARLTILLSFAICLATASSGQSNVASGEAGTRNLKVAAQLPAIQPMDVEFDQDAARPYIYVADTDGAVRVVEVRSTVSVLQTWNVAQSPGGRVVDVEHFSIGGRHYVVAGVADGQAGTLAVAEVTVVRRDAPLLQIANVAVGPVADLFAYKHSSDRVLLAVADGGPIRLFDAASLLTGAAAPLSTIETPEQLEGPTTGFDYVYLGFHPETGADQLYASGAGGFYVFDVTDPANPGGPLVTVHPATMRRGGPAAPTPDGRYLVAAAPYRGAPVRVYDLQPVLAGELPTMRTAESAWAANWKNMCSDFEMRWPLVMAACTDDGFQVFNMRDASQPYTYAWYRTWQPGHQVSTALDREPAGAWTLDVKNTDGLVAVGDLNTGLWLFRLDGFQGWNGHGYGMPNVSSAQDWVGGPDRIGSR